MSTTPQKAMIHTLKSRMGLSDDEYRDMLATFNVQSSKDLSFKAAKEFIEALIKLASGSGAYAPKAKRHASLGNRPNMAYPAQLRKIEALWADVSRMPTEEAKLKALNSFIKNKWGIERIEWLPRNLVGRVVKTLSTMKGVSHD